MALVSLYIKLQDAVVLLGYYTTVDFNIVYETICYFNTTSPCLGFKARASPPLSKYTLPTVNPDPDLDNRLQYRHVYCAGGPDRYVLHTQIRTDNIHGCIVQPLLQPISHSRTPRDRLPATVYSHIQLLVSELFDNRINSPFHGLTFLIPCPALQIHRTCQGAG